MLSEAPCSVQFSVVFSGARVNTGKDLLEGPPRRAPPPTDPGPTTEQLTLTQPRSVMFQKQASMFDHKEHFQNLAIFHQNKVAIQEIIIGTKGNWFISKNAGDFRSYDCPIKCLYFCKHISFCYMFAKIQAFDRPNWAIVIAIGIFKNY